MANFFSRPQHIGDQERHDTAATKGQHRVDDRSGLRVAHALSGIERRPVHPQEQGAQHGEKVRVIDGGVVLVALTAGRAEHETGSDTVVSTKHVYGHGAT